MSDYCTCGHEMMAHDNYGSPDCEECMCDGFRWPSTEGSEG